jgi:hypothetical protein
MSKLAFFINHFLVEIAITTAYVLLVLFYFGYGEDQLKADAIGYFDYLPSMFIYHDMVRKGQPVKETPLLYDRINKTHGYVKYNEYMVNKYSCGTAIMQLPFFTGAFLFTDMDKDSSVNGFHQSFHRAVSYAAIFYLLLTLFFLKKILGYYHIRKWIIVFCQFILVFSTSVTHYANNDAGFSHIYSLFAVTAFIYAVKLFFEHNRAGYFIMASCLLGLVFLLRNVNVLIILIIPFLAGSKEKLWKGVQAIREKKNDYIVGIMLLLAILSVQLFFWYLQTGKWLVYSYQGEGFDFLKPHFYAILFSYNKGLFVYTPVLFISFISACWFLFKRDCYSFICWFSFLIVLTYILSSWYAWNYNCSYGLRAYIDYYAVFIIPFAVFLNDVNKSVRWVVVGLSLITVPVNIIQTYQYKYYILHWIYMDKEKYWKVFLKTDERYRGLVWKEKFESDKYSVEKEIHKGDVRVPEKTYQDIHLLSTDSIPDFQKISVVQIFIDDYYNEDDESAIIVRINHADHCYYWNQKYLIHFHEGKFGEWQTGMYGFQFVPVKDSLEKTITIEAVTADESKNLTNIRLRLLSKN